MSGDPRYLQERREEAAAIYFRTRSVRKVAQEMGVSVSRAHAYLQDAGVEMQKPGRPANVETER